jgi:hypothetical protein
MKFESVFKAKMDRRRLLGNLGMMGAGAVLAACTPALGGEPPEAPNRDAAILNFALNLEYLEAGFYLAAVGRLDELRAIGGDADIRLPAGVAGSNPSESFSREVREFAEELAADELAHVKFLRVALGDVLGEPVATRPTLDFSGSFAAAAEAAGILRQGEGMAFNPYANELFFLHGTFVFEDVGVTAYNGAAPFVTNAEIVLQNAAGILAVEAYHSGAVRKKLYQEKDVVAIPASISGTGSDMRVEGVVQRISDLRGAVGGGKDAGITFTSGAKAGQLNIAPVDSNGVAFPRTPREVANIVFLSDGQAQGGFFPDGLQFPAELAADVEFLLSL